MEGITEQIVPPTLTFLHILSAVIWVGGIIYNQFGAGPALQKLGDSKAHAMSGLASKHYASWTWASFVVLLGTGVYAIFDQWEEITASRGAAILLAVKLGVVLAFVLLFLVQMNYLGPRMGMLINPATPKDQAIVLEMKRLGNTMKGVSWLHLVTGVAVIALGVVLSGTLDQIATEKKSSEEARGRAPLLTPERRMHDEQSDGKDLKKKAEEGDQKQDEHPGTESR